MDVWHMNVWQTVMAVSIFMSVTLMVSNNSHSVESDLPTCKDYEQRRVRFLVVADPQFDNGEANRKANQRSRETLQLMGQLMANDNDIQGLIVAGDLTQNTRVDELAMYRDAISGFEEKVYDSIGNHDDMPATWYQSLACPYLSNCVSAEQVRQFLNRTRETPVISRQYHGALYSWDWQDVHFIQLGLGLTTSEFIPATGHHNYESLQFLEQDLRQLVDSDRPVVIIMHIPLQQNSLLRSLLRQYRIVAMIYGHYHYVESVNTRQLPYIVRVGTARYNNYYDITLLDNRFVAYRPRFDRLTNAMIYSVNDSVAVQPVDTETLSTFPIFWLDFQNINEQNNSVFLVQQLNTDETTFNRMSFNNLLNLTHPYCWLAKDGQENLQIEPMLNACNFSDTVWDIPRSEKVTQSRIIGKQESVGIFMVAFFSSALVTGVLTTAVIILLRKMPCHGQ